MKILLSKDAVINSQDILGRTPLHIAILHDNSTAAGILLANSDIDINVSFIPYVLHIFKNLCLSLYKEESVVTLILPLLNQSLLNEVCRIKSFVTLLSSCSSRHIKEEGRMYLLN